MILLDYLTNKKLIDRTEGEPTNERGGRRKIFYTITPAGMSALKESIEMHNKIWAGLDRAFDNEAYHEG